MSISIINAIRILSILTLSGILIIPVVADANIDETYKISNPEITSDTSKIITTLGKYNISKQDQNRIIQALNNRESIEALVSKKESELNQKKLTIKDQQKGVKISEEFSVDATETYSRIPEGGIIQFNSDGVTRVFSAKGEQVLDVKDSDAQLVMTPSGKMIPKTHIFSVPEYVIVYNSGNRDYYIRDGKILFVKDFGEMQEEKTISPASIGNTWVAYAESDSITNPTLLTSQWIVPHSPTDSINILFNGLEPNDGSYIVQPVVAFNYIEHNDDGISWENHWTGASWLCDQITQPNVCDHAHPVIAVNEGDTITGSVVRIPLPGTIPDLWAITTNDITSGRSTMYLKFYKNASASPSRVVTTYEMLPNQLDRLKLDDTTFTNVVARDTSFNSIPLTMHGQYNLLDHPKLTGLFVDTSQSPSNIKIYTDYSFSIVSTTDGNGEIIPVDEVVDPSGVYLIKSNEVKEFSIIPNSGYQIRDVIVDGQSQGAISEYSFHPVNPGDMKDHTISATFVQSTPPGYYWLEQVIDVQNGPDGLPAYNEALLGSDLGMYTTLGSDSWILTAFSDQLNFNSVTECTIYEYSSYIGWSALTVNPNDYIDPNYQEWNIGTGYETYHVTFINPNQMRISVIGPGGGNILGAVCTVPSSKTTVASIDTKLDKIDIFNNQTMISTE